MATTRPETALRARNMLLGDVNYSHASVFKKLVVISPTALGGSPIWELFRVAYRMTKQPVLIDGLALLSGYCWAALRRMKRPITLELMRFHRREQMKKLRAIFRTLLSFKKVDNFSLVKTESHTRL